MGLLPWDGRVIAIVGTGSDLDRAIAVACAEAGAGLALGTESAAREHDYGMNSIANEIWAIGRDHFVRVLSGPEEIAELAREARTRLGRCDVIVCSLDVHGVERIPVIRPGQPAESTVEAIRAVIEG